MLQNKSMEASPVDTLGRGVGYRLKKSSLFACSGLYPGTLVSTELIDIIFNLAVESNIILALFI